MTLKQLTILHCVTLHLVAMLWCRWMRKCPAGSHRPVTSTRAIKHKLLNTKVVSANHSFSSFRALWSEWILPKHDADIHSNVWWLMSGRLSIIACCYNQWLHIANIGHSQSEKKLIVSCPWLCRQTGPDIRVFRLFSKMAFTNLWGPTSWKSMTLFLINSRTARKWKRQEVRVQSHGATFVLNRAPDL